MNGDSALWPEVTYEIAEHVGEESLSPMEVRVLQMVADGNSNKEIAAKLAVSEEAVQGAGSKYPLQAGRERPHACGRARPEARIII